MKNSGCASAAAIRVAQAARISYESDVSVTVHHIYK